MSINGQPPYDLFYHFIQVYGKKYFKKTGKRKKQCAAQWTPRWNQDVMPAALSSAFAACRLLVDKTFIGPCLSFGPMDIKATDR